MNNLKPIEAGCMAITYGCAYSQNNWIFVNVIQPRQQPDPFRSDSGGNYWEIDREFALVNEDMPLFILGMTNVLAESNLMRIDDPDLKKKSKKSKIFVGDVEVTFNGKPLKGVTVTQHD